MKINEDKPYYEAEIKFDSLPCEYKRGTDLAFLCWEIKEHIKRKAEGNTDYAFGFFNVELYCLGEKTHAVTWCFFYDFEKSCVRFRKGKNW